MVSVPIRLTRTGRAAAVALAIAGGSPAAGVAADLAESAADRTALSLTVYGGGLALVRDTRAAAVPAGRSRVIFADVSRQLVPASPFLAAETGLTLAGLDVRPATLTAQTLLRRAAGREVRVVRTHPTTGEDSVESATVLAVEGGVVLRYRDRVETGVPGRLAFADVPADLRPDPAVVATVDAGAAARRSLTLSYLTNGVSWGADYVIVVDEAKERLDLTARAAVSNGSGTDFKDAQLAVIAGDVRRVSPMLPAPMPRAMAAGVAGAMADAAAEPEREAVADLHLYTIPAAVTLADGETTLVSLFRLPDVAFRREYVSEAYVVIGAARGGPRRPQHPRVELSFDNAAAGPGVPLPAGVARVYTRDGGGALRLAGEDRMEATPVGGTVILSPGRAFDITVERTQTDFDRIGPAKGPFESAQRIEVRNGKDRAVTVKVVEAVPGDWTILEESAGHEKEAADRIVWRVETPALGTAVVTYRIRIQR